MRSISIEVDEINLHSVKVPLSRLMPQKKVKRLLELMILVGPTYDVPLLEVPMDGPSHIDHLRKLHTNLTIYDALIFLRK